MVVGEAVVEGEKKEKALQLLGSLARRSSLHGSMEKAKPRPK